VSFLDNYLNAGEQVVYRTRLHKIIFFWSIFWGVLLLPPAILSIFVGKEERGMAVFMLLLFLVVFLLAFFNFKYSEFGVTNKRVIMKMGVLRTRSVELLLGQVESIAVNQGLLGRMLGYGTITVRGTGGSAEPFSRIVDPMRFRQVVQQQIEERTGKPVAA
jgi:uncharacterized membrane protein YdbT with pleckstrin-like domain